MFRSTSPDEEALVQFAKKNQIVLQHRDHQTIEIQIFDKTEKYEILKVLNFNSVRKRMSIIVRKEGTKDIKMYTKGADDVIFSRTAKTCEPDVKEATRIVNEFAVQGLRTLVMGMKTISECTFIGNNLIRI